VSRRVKGEPATGEYERRVAAHWGETPRSEIRSFWQSPVVMAEINRRITGDPQLAPIAFFAREFCERPRRRALSLGSGDGQLELAAVRVGACEEIVGIDLSPERVARARSRVPEELRDRVAFEVANLETYEPQDRYDVIFAKGVLHHIGDLERWCRTFQDRLTRSGVLYVDDFVGPSRFQWTDAQLRVINRLLAALPERLRRDLVTPDGRLREPVRRPDAVRFAESDPSEAIRSGEITAVLGRHLKPLLVRDYGGAVFHQLFNRIMGNFDADEDLVRMLVEFDLLLTDEGLLAPNYLWGVYRPRRRLGR
jgi:SAM-dependent methyltransferase